VVHIVGTPALSARRDGAILHHNLPGTDYGHFARVAAEVTAAQADLRADVAPGDEIDRVLRVALCTSRPVYLAIPADVAGAPVPAPSGPLAAAPRVGAWPIPAHTNLAGLAEMPSRAAPHGPADPADPLTQRQLWAGLQRFLLPDDLVIADQGTAFYGATGLALPTGARLLGQPRWASAGWALPAALGASLAAPDRRVILIIGDGAFQRTAPELGTMLAQGVAPVVIVLNNGGYTIERAMHNPSAAYHHIPSWNWAALPATVAKQSATVTKRAVTVADFNAALRSASGDTGLPVLIEAVTGWDDTPPLLRDWPGSPAPQTATPPANRRSTQAARPVRGAAQTGKKGIPQCASSR